MIINCQSYAEDDDGGYDDGDDDGEDDDYDGDNDEDDYDDADDDMLKCIPPAVVGTVFGSLGQGLEAAWAVGDKS